jgi:hypothetical protein
LAQLRRLRELLLASPWPLTLGLLVPFQLWMAQVQLEGMRGAVLSEGVMELWVHGRQPTLAWVPFIHPPGYSLFMNITDSTSTWLGVEPALNVLLHGWACRIAITLLVCWAARRWLGTKPALVATALVAFSPNGLRPFEHYPVATLLATVALIAVVEFARSGTRWAAAVAVAAVFCAVEVHLSTWFAVGGSMAAVFFFVPGRRKVAAVASLSMIAAFMATTVPGLWKVLGMGLGDDPEKTVGTLTLEWTNPLLLGLAGLWLLPPLFRRSREAGVLAAGVALFTAVTLGLQGAQIADGQPYPYSLHYFELVDPLLAICAASLFRLEVQDRERGSWQRRLGGAVTVMLLASQLALLFRGQGFAFLNKYWFRILLPPW